MNPTPEARDPPIRRELKTWSFSLNPTLGTSVSQRGGFIAACAPVFVYGLLLAHLTLTAQGGSYSRLSRDF